MRALFFVIACVGVLGGCQAPSVPPSLATNIDATALCGTWTGAWSVTGIQSRLVIKEAFPSGVIRGSYSWDSYPPYGIKAGSLNFYSVSDGESFSFGSSTTGPYLAFTKVGDRIKGTRWVANYSDVGAIVLTRADGTCSTPPSTPPLAFKGEWTGTSRNLPANQASSVAVALTVEAVDSSGLASGTYAWDAFPGESAGVSRWKGRIEGNVLSWKVNQNVLEFVLEADGLHGSKYFSGARGGWISILRKIH